MIQFYTAINSRISFFNLLLISLLLIDTLLCNIYDVFKGLSSELGVFSFVIVILIVIMTSNVLLFKNKSSSKNLEIRNSLLSLTGKLTKITHVILMGLLIILTFQVIFYSEYSIVSVILITQISFTLGGTILCVLGYKFISWYWSRRNTMILLYGLGSILTAMVLLLGSIAQNSFIISSLLSSNASNSGAFLPEYNSLYDIIGLFFTLSYTGAIASYFIFWGASILLIKYYSKILGKIKLYVLTSLPLVLLLIGLTPTILAIPGNNTFFNENLLLFRILAISSAISSGILYGISFITIANNIDRRISNPIVTHLKRAAFGIVILFITLAANIFPGSFPPFGIASYSMIAVAAYFFMMGVYSSAFIVARDADLRKIIQKYFLEECKLLDSIGFALMIHDIENRAIKLVKDKSDDMNNLTGFVDSDPELTAKNYINEIIEEIKKSKLV